MRNILGVLSAVGLALLVSITPVHAIPVDGEISISGGFVPSGGTGLADATGIDFLEWDGSAYVSGTAGGSFTVAAATGDFSTYVTPSPFILGSISDFSFDGSFVPVTPLWSIGGFSFDLLSVTILEQSASTLILQGTGAVYGNGFDSSDGSWVLTANSSGSTFSWSASTAVPETMTLTLFAFVLLGLGISGRRNSQS